jgi:hypothetical protein
MKKQLIFAGTAVLGIVYVPQEKAKPQPQVVEVYLENGRYSGVKSEQRKRELLKQLHNAKAAIRKKAEYIYVDADTRILPVTAKLKTSAYCSKLINTIVNTKNV